MVSTCVAWNFTSINEVFVCKSIEKVVVIRYTVMYNVYGVIVCCAIVILRCLIAYFSCHHQSYCCQTRIRLHAQVGNWFEGLLL